jgi:hypothetical protein
MQSQKHHTGAILLLVLFVLAALTYLCLASLTGITAFVSLLEHKQDAAALMNAVGSFLFQCLIVLIPAFLSFRKMTSQPTVDQPARVPFAFWQIGAGLFVVAAALGLGYLVSGRQPFDFLLLPLFTLIAIPIPIFLLFGLASRRLEVGTRWRFWSVFGLGMTLGPLTLIVAELAIGLVLLIGVVAYVLITPGLADEMLRLSAQMQYITDPDQALNLLTPYLADPRVLFLTLGYIALLVPFLEELLKPIGVWIFSRQIKTPAEGFVLGALSGAAYGMIESLGVSSVSGADWVGLIATRAGTGLLHVTTSGLMGWAIISAVQEKKYLRFLLAYFGAILLHGAWNGMTVLVSFSSLGTGLQNNDLSALTVPAIGALVMLAGGLFILLLQINRRLHPAPVIEPTPGPESVIPPEESHGNG